MTPPRHAFLLSTFEGPGPALARLIEAGRLVPTTSNEDCVTAPGRLLAMSLDPIYHHGCRFMPAATRFLHGVPPWLRTAPAHAADIARTRKDRPCSSP